MWQGIDRRKFPRADYICDIVVFKKGTHENISGRTENIGTGGFCLLLKEGLDKFLPVETVLYVKDGKPPIKCDARIVWVVKQEAKFDTGIEFIDILPADALRLERIVQECLKNQ